MVSDWVIFALAAAFSSGFSRIIHRYIMKNESHIAYSWILNVIGAIFLIFPLLGGVNIPVLSPVWLIVLFASSLWTAVTLIGFESYKHTQLSLREPLSRTSILFLLFFSVIVIGETVTVAKITGILIIFAGLITLLWRGKSFNVSNRGVKLTLSAAVLVGLVSVVDKVAVGYFQPALYAFLLFIVPAIYLTPAALNDRSGIKSIAKNKLVTVILVSLLTAASYYFQIFAYSLTEVSNVFPILQLSTLVAVFGGYFVHKEKDLVLRIAGAVLMIIGSVFIVLP